VVLSDSDTALRSESRKSSFTILSRFTSLLQVREGEIAFQELVSKWNRPFAATISIREGDRRTEIRIQEFQELQNGIVGS